MGLIGGLTGLLKYVVENAVFVLVANIAQHEALYKRQDDEEQVRPCVLVLC
jgi:hypothetical protein